QAEDGIRDKLVTGVLTCALPIFFGYFPASLTDPGFNLPGQTVFTCLSHDIIAHETTHALVDSQRDFFMEPTDQDAPAFHEAFARSEERRVGKERMCEGWPQSCTE